MTVFVLGAGATRGASFVSPEKGACFPPLDADFFAQTHDGRGSRTSMNCTYHNWLVDQMGAGDTTISYNYDCLVDYALQARGRGKWNAYYGYGFAELAEQGKLDQHP